MGDRCATRSFLQLVSSERPWTGKPSTTQLIAGTMLSFLKLTQSYAISPDSRAFMIHGTKGHAALEAATDEYSELEVRFDGEDTKETGIADVLEMELNKRILADYKTSGSYKVAKALGFTTKDEPTGEYFKSGKNKGKEKMRKVLIRNDSAIDRWEWEYQLNKYRVEAERRGKKVDEIRIQCVVRDGGTYIARSRGVFRNIYYFKINRLDDSVVLSYFEKKRNDLLQALKQGFWPHVCDAKENWDGLRCKSYCEVAEFCPFGKYLKEERLKEDEMIKGLSEIRRLPRLGKIRLGKKVANKSGNGDHPTEVDYFVFDPQTPAPEENDRLKQIFAKLYGDEPKSISIMFPVPDAAVFFPQDYKRYGSSTSLQCKGDGEVAVCAADDFATGLKIIGRSEMGGPKVECKGRECPYYKSKKCTEVGILQFLLPELPGMGVWQITTGSYHSIVSVNSCIDYIRQVCGRVHMIPLKLERIAQETAYEGKKATHYILQINTAFGITDLQRLANVDPTKIMLGLPEPEPDKEDILLQGNARIEAVDAEFESVPSGATPPGMATAPQAAQAEASPLDKLAAIVATFEPNANTYLIGLNWVKSGETWRHLTADKIKRILDKPKAFEQKVAEYAAHIKL
jgi:hypothetical protein